MEKFPDLPPVWAAAFGLAAIVAARVLPILTFPQSKLLATVFLCAGFGVILWSAFYFWKKKTPIEPHHTPKALIVEGPYRMSRNPIYLGMFLGLLGIAVWSGGLIAIVIVCFFPLVITKRFVAAEETALRGQFGQEADHYLASTARWFLIR